jgi:glycerate dehydrogenase
LDSFGTVTRYARTAPGDLAGVAADAEIIVTNKVPIDGTAMQALPKLRHIAVAATGYNIIDVQAAAERGIAVSNVPGYSTASVAQATIALLLECCNNVGAHARRVAQGDWSTCPDFCFLDSPIRELTGATLLLLGAGAIGGQVAVIAQALGMRVINGQLPGRPARPDRLPLTEALPQADVISLHCPLTPETSGLIGTATLGLCKPDCILLNTARGPLIDEPALANWLDTHPDARCGLDVLTQEPPRDGSPLIGHPQVHITPHNAWAGNQARARLRSEISANVAAWQRGERRNRVG